MVKNKLRAPLGIRNDWYSRREYGLVRQFLNRKAMFTVERPCSRTQMKNNAPQKPTVTICREGSPFFLYVREDSRHKSKTNNRQHRLAVAYGCPTAATRALAHFINMFLTLQNLGDPARSPSSRVFLCFINFQVHLSSSSMFCRLKRNAKFRLEAAFLCGLQAKSKLPL